MSNLLGVGDVVIDVDGYGWEVVRETEEMWLLCGRNQWELRRDDSDGLAKIKDILRTFKEG